MLTGLIGTVSCLSWSILEKMRRVVSVDWIDWHCELFVLEYS